MTAPDLLFAALVVFVWRVLALRNRKHPLAFAELVFRGCWNVGFFVWFTIAGDHPVARLALAAYTGWCAYWAWKRRKPRHRKPSKALGRVRDLGHRLVVTNS